VIAVNARLICQVTSGYIGFHIATVPVCTLQLPIAMKNNEFVTVLGLALMYWGSLLFITVVQRLEILVPRLDE